MDMDPTTAAIIVGKHGEPMGGIHQPWLRGLTSFQPNTFIRVEAKRYPSAIEQQGWNRNAEAQNSGSRVVLRDTLL